MICCIDKSGSIGKVVNCNVVLRIDRGPKWLGTVSWIISLEEGLSTGMGEGGHEMGMGDEAGEGVGEDSGVNAWL